MTPRAQTRQDLDGSYNDTTLYRGNRTGTRVPNNSGLTGSDYRNGNNDGALNKDTIPPPEPGESGVHRKWRLPSEQRAAIGTPVQIASDPLSAPDRRRPHHSSSSRLPSTSLSALPSSNLVSAPSSSILLRYLDIISESIDKFGGIPNDVQAMLDHILPPKHASSPAAKGRSHSSDSNSGSSGSDGNRRDHRHHRRRDGKHKRRDRSRSRDAKPAPKLDLFLSSSSVSLIDFYLNLAGDSPSIHNPFYSAFTLFTSAQTPFVSHIPLLERRSGWNDWITALVASLEEINLSGFVLDSHDLPASNSPWKQPIYPFKNSTAGLSTNEERVAHHIWGQLDGFARHVITTCLGRDVYRKVKRFLSATSDAPTSRDWYSALKSWYSYESGRAAWKVAEVLVCGRDVLDYLTRYRELVQAVKDSVFCVSPTLMLTTLLCHLPSLGHLHAKFGIGTPSFGLDEFTFDNVLRWIQRMEEWFGSGVECVVNVGKDSAVVLDGGDGSVIAEFDSVSANNLALDTLDVTTPHSHVAATEVLSFAPPGSAAAVVTVTSTAVNLEACAPTKSGGHNGNGALLALEDPLAGADGAVVFDGGNDTLIEDYSPITTNLTPVVDNVLLEDYGPVGTDSLMPASSIPGIPSPPSDSPSRRFHHRPVSLPVPQEPWLTLDMSLSP
ncbi:hypothetical protein DFP72DRAFT_1068827 [Ephemerocybe angulata]|uniref:Uncharacterized protein n=1 Tax=Ephemerocybe angulata TaxID=980116 RepID=A0A8H6HY70_9AGAR|nr:hypothetical protein DFP72DRAFT_1068827 [Tulosesus angulatus]